MKTKTLNVLAVIGLLLTAQPAVSIADDFAPGEWCPVNKTITNPDNGHQVPLVLTKCNVTIGYYDPDNMVPDPDNKICENSPESCIMLRPLSPKTRGGK
ncbi:MAG: hypothetical protein HRT35_08420 [Algicola sp.]|nr:hypothetical protein [Algicola sp.]